MTSAATAADIMESPENLLENSSQCGGEQGTYFGSNSRLSAGLHQAFNWPCVSLLVSYYLSCCLPMQYFLFFNIKFTKSIFKIRADLHIIKDLKAIAEDFQSFWPPGRESASKYICRFAGFLKVC